MGAAVEDGGNWGRYALGGPVSGATVRVANTVAGIDANRDLFNVTWNVSGDEIAHDTKEAHALRQRSVVSHAPLVAGARLSWSHGEAAAPAWAIRSTPHGEAARQVGLACPMTGTRDSATTTNTLTMRRNMRRNYPILALDSQSFSRDGASVLPPPWSH